MFRLVTRALSALAFGVLALFALLWQWAVANPVLAWVLIPTALGVCWLVGREMRKQKAAIHDARMREEHVPSMSPLEYEQFAARLLERAGWKVSHCGRAGDQGCDVVAELRGFKAVVQCKLYRVRVGNNAVQQIAGARRHYNAQIMVVVAPSGFTRSAEQLAASNGVNLMHHSQLHALESAARIP
jgi:restriction system protein